MTDTSVWDEVLVTAITGTRRRTAPTGRWLAELGVEAPADREPQVMDVAAVLTAGRARGPVLEGSRTPPEPVHDPRPDFPLAVFTRLNEESGGPRPGFLVAEMVATAARLGLRAPSTAVPPLLDLAAGNAHLRPEIRELVGPVGQLLAGMNPKWQPVFAQPGADGDDLWLNPDPQVRLRWLAELRRTDPDRARELVVRALAPRPEKAEFKARILRLLADPEQPEDLPVLEGALTAKTDAERFAARHVLSRRPGSPYQQRMLRRFEQWVRVRGTLRRRTVHAEFPPDFDEADRRDGFGAGRPDQLAYLAEQVPLAAWGRHGTPATIVAALSADEDEPVLRALESRAWLERDQAWGRALFAAGRGATSWGGVLVPQELADQRIREELDAFAAPTGQDPGARTVPRINRAVMPHVAACIPRLPLTRLLELLTEVVTLPEPGPDLILWLRQAQPLCGTLSAHHVEEAVGRLTVRLWALDQLHASAGAAPPFPSDPTSPSRGEP